MIRVKHHQLPKDLALAQLEAEIDEEYEEEIEHKEEHKEAPKSAPHYNIPAAKDPLPATVQQPVDETFKLRRKRRV
jgi:hypothetical protein